MVSLRPEFEMFITYPSGDGEELLGMDGSGTEESIWACGVNLGVFGLHVDGV